MVAVAVFQQLADHAVHGRDAGGGVVERAGQGTVEIPEIAVADIRSTVPIDAVHELAPADDLADEALQRVQGNAPGPGHHAVDDVLRIQQADVERRGDGGVIDRGVFGGDRVFVEAEVFEALVDEPVQPGFRVGSGDRPAEVLQRAGVVGEFPGDVIGGLAGEGIGRSVRLGGRDVVLGQLRAVLSVERPLAAERASVGL